MLFHHFDSLKQQGFSITTRVFLLFFVFVVVVVVVFVAAAVVVCFNVNSRFSLCKRTRDLISLLQY